MERETGFEPATSTLARLHSTAELFPRLLSQLSVKITIFRNTCQARMRTFRWEAGETKTNDREIGLYGDKNMRKKKDPGIITSGYQGVKYPAAELRGI